jgi:predicted nucleotidyltransferase
MPAPHISILPERIASCCRRNHIQRLAFSGSALRENFRPESDVDVLVEFEPGHPVGFFGLARIEHQLSEIVGRKVVLRAAAELSP